MAAGSRGRRPSGLSVELRVEGDRGVSPAVTAPRPPKRLFRVHGPGTTSASLRDKGAQPEQGPKRLEVLGGSRVRESAPFRHAAEAEATLPAADTPRRPQSPRPWRG